MDKLIEREPATRNTLVAAPALAVQFFLIPLAVVALTGGVYIGFRSLLADDRGPQPESFRHYNGRLLEACHISTRLVSEWDSCRYAGQVVTD